MRRLLLLLSSLVVACGCGSILHEPPSLATGDRADLHAIVDEAAQWWGVYPRRVPFVVYGGVRVSPGDIEVVATDELVNPPSVAASEYDPNTGTIRIRPAYLTDPNVPLAVCLVAHEMGHSLGLDHIDGDSLMNAFVKVPPDAECYWSDADQAQLEKLR